MLVGWNSWNMFSTMLFLGIKIVIFEGYPYFLSPTYFWDMVEELQINHLFFVPRVLEDMQKKGYVPREGSLPVKFTMCGANVVPPQIHEFAYKQIKCEIFSSIYGLTECMGCSLFHDQTQKIYKGEIPGPSLGVEIECLDDAGKPVLGSLGKLVFSKPIPSLVQGIWGDTDGSLLKKAYYDTYPGKFFVGDLAVINPFTRGIFVYGRSDETLKPRRCRFGSSEIYNIVDTFSEICDSICVSHYNKNKVERVVLFLMMNKGHPFEESLAERLRTAIAKDLCVDYVPQVILETTEIPYNMNGKKMESVVKKIINKMPYNPEIVVNPDCLRNFIDVPELGEF